MYYTVATHVGNGAPANYATACLVYERLGRNVRAGGCFHEVRLVACHSDGSTVYEPSDRAGCKVAPVVCRAVSRVRIFRSRSQSFVSLRVPQ